MTELIFLLLAVTIVGANVLQVVPRVLLQNSAALAFWYGVATSNIPMILGGISVWVALELLDHYGL